ncbi:hypothetical protein MED01_002430 [Micromonospora sp. MED01]|uniref:hypothetical protein n=1 Tax=Micromonospora alfalfae TaxID=2911212 RepID=UPI001EE94694|nr:hypothetical protein [Micromonospora alfalfae]MCG5464264.1 hypothetical protein [Micromonospora alfalfae]
MTAKDEALAALAAHRADTAPARAQLDRERAKLDALDVEHVAACRNAGVTWQAIADVFGVAQETVIKKYKPKLAVETRVRPKTGKEAS